MIDFEKSIYENRMARKLPFLVAHRGVSTGNIPCNTMAAFGIAVAQGADVVEIDVSITKDHQFYVFHPGMEKVFLKCDRSIKDMTAEELDALFLVNQDDVVTSYKVPKLSEVLAFLKGKVYINVDKFWTDVEGISEEIRRAGVEKQVIVKTPTDAQSLESVRTHARDLMFMPLVNEKDEVTDWLLEEGINVIGAEVLFKTEASSVISDDYIERMHEKNLLIWANSIVYNERAVISAHHTDDVALTGSPEQGWGWLVDKQVDFVQTDWLLMLKNYLEKRG